jgi:hypothetical protein
VKSNHKFRESAGKALALLMVATVLSLSLISSSPALHRLLHGDADAAEHQCAVTLFAHGQVESAAIPAAVICLIVLFGGVVLLSDTFLLPAADYRFSASRAPPASASFPG